MMRAGLLCVLLCVVAIGCTRPAAQRSPEGAARSIVGGPCREDVDCAAGLRCDKDDPGGECTKACASDAECGPQGACNAEKECLQACKAPEDCKRAGYTCITSGAAKVCDIPEAAEKR